MTSPVMTAIEVAGFKSAIDPVRVNFRDITVLAGTNSAGKSTIMQPLLLIKQTLEKPFDPGGLAIDGPLVRFTRADQIFSRRSQRESAGSFVAKYDFGQDAVSFRYERSETAGIELAEMHIAEQGENLVWKDGLIPHPGDGSMPEFLSTLGTGERPRRVQIWRDGVVLIAGVKSGDKDKPHPIEYRSMPAEAAKALAGNMIYLPGLRGNPERHYPFSAVGERYPGSFDNYTASVIHHWATTHDERLHRLEHNLYGLGLTSRIATSRLDDTNIEIRVGRLPASVRANAKDIVNVADVGFGVSQTLPVLVALLAAARDQMVFVEQPELHLHPRAQVALADILIQAADQGVRLVIETHSSLLILALQAAIAEGRIAPDRVSLNWFTRDATGQTHVAEAQIGDDGSYGDWPEDFGAIELDLQDRYMTLVERRHARG
jgi:hypothetical protein